MSKVRMDIAERVGSRADNIVILDGQTYEVPDKMLVEEIPYGRTLEAFENESVKISEVKLRDLDENSVLIKLQGQGGYRERYAVVIKKTTHVKQLIEDYKEKFGHHDKEFKLMFDGDDIDLSETAETLDLENNDMMDVVEV